MRRDGRTWGRRALVPVAVWLLVMGIGRIAVPQTFSAQFTGPVLAVALGAEALLVALAPRTGTAFLLLVALGWNALERFVVFDLRRAGGADLLGAIGGDVIAVYLPIALVAGGFALAVVGHPPFREAATGGAPAATTLDEAMRDAAKRITLAPRLLALCLAALVRGGG